MSYEQLEMNCSIADPDAGSPEDDARSMRAAAGNLIGAFRRASTPEGNAFWRAIYDRLIAMADGLGAHLEAQKAEAEKAAAAAKFADLLQGIEVRQSSTLNGKVTVRIPTNGFARAGGRRLSPSQAREMAHRLLLEAADAEAAVAV
jgi:hypothetical protein